MSVGTKIRRLRLQNKWSQEELAHKLNVAQTSVSNFESFQSNRVKLRFKGNDGKTQLAHTLNGSALALPRIVAALLENNYNGQYIQIPKAIQHYTGFDRID